MMTTIRPVVASALLVVACSVAACGGGPTATSPDPTPTASSTSASASSSAPTATSIDGMFDVGGHRLYLTCAGTRTPTVVYLHGSITDPNFVPHQSAAAISNALSGQYRVCLYDRRNLGNSDTVDAVQTPKDTLTDLHRLLAGAEVEPPYVLLGASFGGMLAYLCANSYRTLKAGQRFIGKEPKIPVIYLASVPEGYDTQGLGKEYGTKIVQLQRDYVDRFSPGMLKKVDAPRFMEPVIPDRIAEEVRAVIVATGQR